MKVFKIILAFTCLLMFVGVIFVNYRTTKTVEKQLSCDPEAPSTITFFLIDTSDEIIFNDAETVISTISTFLSEANNSNPFYIFSLNFKDHFRPIEIFGSCTFPQAKKVDSISVSRDRVKLIDSKFLSNLEETKKSVRSNLSTSMPSKTSPLLESIVSISRRPDFRYAQKINIIIFSDMEQNTDILSVFKNNFKKTFDSMNFSELSIETISLHNADIRVFPIVRRDQHRLKMRSQVKSFWNRWFAFSSSGGVKWEE